MLEEALNFFITETLEIFLKVLWNFGFLQESVEDFSKVSNICKRVHEALFGKIQARSMGSSQKNPEKSSDEFIKEPETSV